jgi:L-alanine-DL-glutamate epimerase-like enolase superfamily enzyme
MTVADSAGMGTLRRALRMRDLMRNNVEFKDGHLLAPQKPGLGIEVDEEAVKRAVVK